MSPKQNPFDIFSPLDACAAYLAPLAEFATLVLLARTGQTPDLLQALKSGERLRQASFRFQDVVTETIGKLRAELITRDEPPWPPPCPTNVE